MNQQIIKNSCSISLSLESKWTQALTFNVYFVTIQGK
eukprot:UN02406